MSKRKLSDAPLPRNKAPKPQSLNSRHQYTIGIITALEIESTAATAVLDELHDPPQDSTNLRTYEWGAIAGHNVAIACIAEGWTGKASAAATVTKMIETLPSIRFGLMVGIGGGIPNHDHDIRLGDIVVSIPKGQTGGVVQYDLGKSTLQGFQRTGSLNSPPQALLSAVTSLRRRHRFRRSRTQIPRIVAEAVEEIDTTEYDCQYQGTENDRLFKPSYDHQSGADCADCNSDECTARIDRQDPSVPSIHYGLIASGGRVIKNAVERDELAAWLEEDTGARCLCFEMEAAGLMNSFPCLVIRGISDYADSHKNDAWQPYAAMTAAAYAKELLEALDVKGVEETPPATQKVLNALNRVNENVHELYSEVTAEKEMSSIGRLQKWLNPPDPSVNYNMAIETRLNNTGNWLLSHRALEDFKTGGCRFVWLQGSGGCGKTVLAASVIENLEVLRSQNSAVLYFFFDFRDSLKQSLDGLLRSLLQQVLAGPYNPQAKDALDTLFLNCGYGSSQPSINRLIITLNHAFSELHEVQILLDALDECPLGSRTAVLEWICRLMGGDESRRVKIGIFVTSRSSQQDIECELATIPVEKHVLFVESKDDIRGFVKSRLLTGKDFQIWRNCPEDNALLQKIEDTVISKAGTM
ncbi:pfs domain-containing protein [Phyllosticta capitalensis]